MEELELVGGIREEVLDRGHHSVAEVVRVQRPLDVALVTVGLARPNRNGGRIWVGVAAAGGPVDAVHER